MVKPDWSSMSTDNMEQGQTITNTIVKATAAPNAVSLADLKGHFQHMDFEANSWGHDMTPRDVTLLFRFKSFSSYPPMTKTTHIFCLKNLL